jgi:hypothetical protein
VVAMVMMMVVYGQSEWLRDSEGKEFMDFPVFCRALFELVGEWS